MPAPDLKTTVSYSISVPPKLLLNRQGFSAYFVSDFQTVLVDPPRAGLDSETLQMVSAYSRIIYISCNPETLIENLDYLTKTHDVTAAAMFDQFPYTDHVETGVVLEVKTN